MKRGWVVAMVLASVCPAVSPRVMGQAMPVEAVTAPSLSPEQVQKLRAFTEARLARLRSTDATERETARDELLAPLDSQGVTIAFRLEYSKLIAPDLGRLASDRDDHGAFNALRLAGKLGTTQGFEIVRAALGDERPAVRIGAARAAREALKWIAGAPQSPVQPARLGELVDRLASSLASESHPVTARSLVLALDAPRAGSPSSPSAELHALALEKMADALSARIASVRAAGPGTDASPWTEAVVAGVDALRRTFIDPQRAGVTSRAGLRKASAGLCGQAIALLRARASHGLGGSPDSASLRTVANASEAVLLLIESAERAQKLGSAFTSAVESGDASGFIGAADEWIGPSGRLGKPPFSLDVSRFK